MLHEAEVICADLKRRFAHAATMHPKQGRRRMRIARDITEDETLLDIAYMV